MVRTVTLRRSGWNDTGRSVGRAAQASTSMSIESTIARSFADHTKMHLRSTGVAPVPAPVSLPLAVAVVDPWRPVCVSANSYLCTRWLKMLCAGVMPMPPVIRR